MRDRGPSEDSIITMWRLEATNGPFIIGVCVVIRIDKKRSALFTGYSTSSTEYRVDDNSQYIDRIGNINKRMNKPVVMVP
jgi:hypothetical protein